MSPLARHEEQQKTHHESEEDKIDYEKALDEEGNLLYVVHEGLLLRTRLRE